MNWLLQRRATRQHKFYSLPDHVTQIRYTRCTKLVIQHLVSISSPISHYVSAKSHNVLGGAIWCIYRERTGLACKNIKSTLLHGFPSIRLILPLNKRFSLITVYLLRAHCSNVNMRLSLLHTIVVCASLVHGQAINASESAPDPSATLFNSPSTFNGGKSVPSTSFRRCSNNSSWPSLDKKHENGFRTPR